MPAAIHRPAGPRCGARGSRSAPTTAAMTSGTNCDRLGGPLDTQCRKFLAQGFGAAARRRGAAGWKGLLLARPPWRPGGPATVRPDWNRLPWRALSRAASATHRCRCRYRVAGCARGHSLGLSAGWGAAWERGFLPCAGTGDGTMLARPARHALRPCAADGRFANRRGDRAGSFKVRPAAHRLPAPACRAAHWLREAPGLRGNARPAAPTLPPGPA